MPLSSKSRFFVTARFHCNLTGVTVSAISLYDTFPIFSNLGNIKASTVWHSDSVPQVVFLQESQVAILEQCYAQVGSHFFSFLPIFLS